MSPFCRRVPEVLLGVPQAQLVEPQDPYRFLLREEVATYCDPCRRGLSIFSSLSARHHLTSLVSLCPGRSCLNFVFAQADPARPTKCKKNWEKQAETKPCNCP